VRERDDSPAYIIQGGSDHGKTELKSVVFKEGSEKGKVKITPPKQLKLK
jgi:hypothetical protein